MDTLPPLQRGKGIFVNLTLDGICRLHLSGGHAKILLRIYEEAERWGDKDRSAVPKKAGNAMEKSQMNMHCMNSFGYSQMERMNFQSAGIA